MLIVLNDGDAAGCTCVDVLDLGITIVEISISNPTGADEGVEQGTIT